MPPSFPLIRRPLDVDPFDEEAVRRWLCALVAEEVQLKGQPRPRVVLLYLDHQEVFDLDTMARGDPDAHAGATWQALRKRPSVDRALLVIQLIVVDMDDQEHRSALVFEQLDDDEPTRWWAATLQYHADPTTGLGTVGESWQVLETDDIDRVHPFFREWIEPPPGARAAEIGPIVRPQPSIQAMFGDLDEAIALPTTPDDVVNLAGGMLVKSILADGLTETLVLRFHRHAWELFRLGDDQPAELDEMVRLICKREPEADAVSILLVAVLPEDDPPVPGIQIVAEHDGMRGEHFAILDFPEGPGGPKRISGIKKRTPWRVAEGTGWLGVEPMVLFDLTALGPVE